MRTRRRLLILGILGSVLLAAQEITTLYPGHWRGQATTHAYRRRPRENAAIHATMTNNGMETVYAGVWLHEVLKKAGVPQASELRGKALPGYVLAEAQDAYQLVFSLGELDPAFIDNEIAPADTANGKPCLEPKAGCVGLGQKTSPPPDPSACSPSSTSFN
jgi:hypothetical protein